MNNTYSDATFENDLKAIREANTLDSTEMNLLAGILWECSQSY